MVFGTDMMINVALNLNVPIKLILPFKDKPSIIGLGDIVIPGVLVGWALKFDVDKAIEAWNQVKQKPETFPKP